jgi:predicted RNase H-like nuclease
VSFWRPVDDAPCLKPSGSAPVAGVDVMGGAWLIALRDGRDLELRRAPAFEEVVVLTAGAVCVAVDMPIGFPEHAAAGGRDCERLARARLRARASSVFSSPCRRALGAASYAEANAINRASSPDRRGLSRQAWCLFRYMREIDRIITPALQARIVEAHPELAFTALRDQVAQHESDFRTIARKHSEPGRAQRAELLRRAGFADLDRILQRGRALGARADDVLDACVVAWTAARIADGIAGRLPAEPPKDARGLRMEVRF